MLESFVLHYLLVWQPLGYLIGFFGMMIEGDALLFTLTFLTSQGYFSFSLMLFSLFAGVLIGDWLWYQLGKHLHNSSWRLAQWIHKLASPLDKHLLDNPRRTIFISKFTYGVHHALLMRAGALHLPPKEFLKNDVLATVAWISVVGGLGYLSGASFLLVKHYVRYAEIGLLLGIALMLVITHVITRRSRV